MNSLPTPPPLSAPFAASGDRSNLPYSSGGEYGAASLQAGFPPETSLPLSGGGVPPKREDMNALGYAASFPQYFLQAGGYYTYNTSVAAAIGGYPLGAVLTYYNSSGGEVRKLRSLVPNNSYNFITSPGVIGTYWQDVTPVVGFGRTMFEFFWNFSKEIPAGALELNGQILTGCNNSNSIYHKFYIEGKRLRDAGKLAARTMQQYISDLTAYGECNAFVFDQAENGTPATGNIRIPTIRHFVQAGTPGNIHAAGLPNISGEIGEISFTNSGTVRGFVSGAFVRGASTNLFDDFEGNGHHPIYRVIFDANSGATVKGIYGGAQTVQPQSVELVPCIQYAPGTGAAGESSGGNVIDGDLLVKGNRTVLGSSYLSGGMISSKSATEQISTPSPLYPEESIREYQQTVEVDAAGWLIHEKVTHYAYGGGGVSSIIPGVIPTSGTWTLANGAAALVQHFDVAPGDPEEPFTASAYFSLGGIGSASGGYVQTSGDIQSPDCGFSALIDYRGIITLQVVSGGRIVDAAQRYSSCTLSGTYRKGVVWENGPSELPVSEWGSMLEWIDVTYSVGAGGLFTPTSNAQ